ncbi:hypothetical protein N7448_000578 [Penicillium atrosanguineum]|uniref:Uncharacterized protein n=1 Tax=Penicillium atrosanguineum TaxID=1132637 RepID=A0A9W9Q3B0_9EURO|nr:Scramblase-domain-containing protein [Penicillium atrosanguineum]KAJ5134400.1 hypothetical protein N7526_005765 [Penicillium atrosanguineum]KAJ5149000.1 hypothetical protein N7448_000578 [Penicillium atrosanguineum]KAJ5304315.1 Scramblase-domain-containing protein [Penicillium atrosanguineum]KAJ5323790.1 hypothetical protein N7476_002390 [Penicillium atrosanguineum]
MGASDDSSFFLYGVGERPEALTLGSLVLEKYWQPMIARHYTHDILSDNDLRKNAYATNLTNVVLHGTSRITPSVGVEAGDIVNLNLAYNKDRDRIVVAEKGTRIILKDPEEFLMENVLNNPLAQQKLKLWLSAAQSAYVLNFKFARRPKVWLMTGLYLLEGTKTVVSRSDSAKISAGISSALIGALSGIPIGGSVSLGVDSSWDMTMEVSDPHVWAAQYRLLDARFIKMGKSGVDGVKLPATLGLYRDVMSVNTARGGGGQSIELGLKEEEKRETKAETEADLGTPMDDDQDSMELEEYEKRLEQAIKVFEKAPKHFLQ